VSHSRATQDGHIHVQNENVRQWRASQNYKALLAGCCTVDFMSLLPQKIAERLDDVIVIIDEEKMRHEALGIVGNCSTTVNSLRRNAIRPWAGRSNCGSLDVRVGGDPILT